MLEERGLRNLKLWLTAVRNQYDLCMGVGWGMVLGSTYISEKYSEIEGEQIR